MKAVRYPAINMSNQDMSVATHLLSSVDVDDLRFNPQRFINAVKQGRVRGPLTEWIIAEGWNQGKFVVRDKLAVNKSDTAEVRISSVGENVKNWFWKLVEGPSVDPNFGVLTLRVWSYDHEIIPQIGGIKRAISSWGEIHGQMKKQSKGEEGKLLTNGATNIFYVPQLVSKIDEKSFSYVDLQGEAVSETLTDPKYLFEVDGNWYVLRAVGVRWNDVGWFVRADSVGGPSGWGGGDRVFSRNSVLESSEPSAPVQA